MSIDVDKLLGGVGGVLLKSFGPGAVEGFLMGLITATPYECYEFIRDKKPLFPDLDDEDVGKIRAALKRIGIKDFSDEHIIALFQEYHPDLLGVVINHPDGIRWLGKQIGELRERLDLPS